MRRGGERRGRGAGSPKRHGYGQQRLEVGNEHWKFVVGTREGVQKKEGRGPEGCEVGNSSGRRQYGEGLL